MKMLLFLSLAVVCIPSHVVAQQAVKRPQAERDAKAVAIVQRSLSAMGWSAVTSDSYAWAITVQTVAAQDNPTQGTTTTTWRVAGAEYRAESEHGSVCVSGHGKPGCSGGGKVQHFPPYIAAATIVPGMIGKHLNDVYNDNAYSLAYRGSGEISNKQVEIVELWSTAPHADAQTTMQIVYFDSSSGFPLRVAYEVLDVHRSDRGRPSHVDFSDYQSQGGILYPFTSSEYSGSHLTATDTLQSLNAGGQYEASIFDLDGGAK